MCCNFYIATIFKTRVAELWIRVILKEIRIRQKVVRDPDSRVDSNRTFFTSTCHYVLKIFFTVTLYLKSLHFSGGLRQNLLTGQVIFFHLFFLFTILTFFQIKVAHYSLIFSKKTSNSLRKPMSEFPTLINTTRKFKFTVYSN